MKEQEKENENVCVQGVVKCKHPNTWIIGAGSFEWCYECGSFRTLKGNGQRNQLVPISAWANPSGIGGKNPWDVFSKRNDIYRKRMKIDI